MQKSDFTNEWCLLQNQFDSYEKYSLTIKLFAITLLSTAFILNTLTIFILILLIILWVQDAIWKTFQSRIETRLLQLEKDIANEHSSANKTKKAYQFNSLYLLNRPSNIALINEYLRQAIRPTIAFPHIFLLLLLSFKLIF